MHTHRTEGDGSGSKAYQATIPSMGKMTCVRIISAELIKDCLDPFMVL